jgi:hypothetical protein
MTRSRPFTAVAAVVLLVVALAHLIRVVEGWQVTIADSEIPQWVSIVAFVVAGGLSLMLFRESRG